MTPFGKVIFSGFMLNFGGVIWKDPNSNQFRAQWFYQ